MGLFKSFTRAISSIAETAGSLFSTVARAATPLVRAAAPIAIAAIQARTGGLLGGAAGGLAIGGRGSQAVVATGATAAQCPIPGVVGKASRNSAVFGAAVNPPNNPATQVARPAFGLQQIINAIIASQAAPVQQTTSFNQGAFGSSVSPSFRPFSPSFRSGQAGTSGPFTPGISRGLAPGFGFGGF